MMIKVFFWCIFPVILLSSFNKVFHGLRSKYSSTIYLIRSEKGYKMVCILYIQ